MPDIKVCKDCYIPKDQIKLYVGYGTNPVKNDVRRLKKENKVLDYTKGKKIASVIYLITGELVLTPLNVETLRQRMEGKEES